jgi:hypothetical protein
MKKLITCLVTAFLLVTLVPIQSKAETKENISASTETESEKIVIMMNRVAEIDAMDKSTMSPLEKKELRREVRTLKKDVNNHSHNHGGGTVYVSAGLIILIVVLIIIL